LSDVVDYNWFEGARDVTSLINTCSANAAYSTVNATADRAAGSCWSNGPNYNRWFKFTATSKYIKVQLNVGGSYGTLQNPFLALWNASLTQLNCQNYQGASVSIETDYYGLTVGQTYYISVDNYSGTGYRGTFSLCLSDVPDYNYFEGAKDVTSLINGCSANAAYTTLNATADRSAGSCWSNGPNYNRWFKFTATSTQYIKVQVNVGGSFGTLQNPFVALWDASLTQLNCQNFQGASVSIETDYYGLTAGQTYYISVDNYSGTGYRGTFSLCLSDAPDYNYLEGAVSITDLNNWCSSNAAYTTVNATADRNKGSCWTNGPSYNRWFKFVAVTPNVTIQLQTGGAFGTLQNPFISLWQSDGVTEVACKKYTSTYVIPSLTSATLVVGNTYYISVDNYVGAGYRGTFTLCVSNVSPNIFYSRANGDFNTASTWSNVGYGGAAASSAPSAGNVVNIQNNVISVTSAAQCAEVNISASTTNSSITIDNSTLTVNGKFAVTNASNNSVTTTIQNNGIVSIANNLNLTRTGGNSSTQFNITSGSASIGQDINWTSSSGTVSTNSMTLGNSSALSVSRDVNLIYSGGMKISLNFNNSASIVIGRDLAFSSSAAGQTEVIFNNSSAMSIKRNITRVSSFGSLTFNNTSTLTFNGTGNQQTIAASAGSGGDAIYYNNVTFNNTSGISYPFVMGGVATINGTMTMTRGLIQTTASNYLNLKNSSSTSIGNTSCYIDGPMSYEVASNTPNTAINFPIGNNGSYRPVILTVTHSNSNSVIYTAQHFSSSSVALGYTLAPTTDQVSVFRYWTINSSDQSNLSSAKVTLYYGYGTTDHVYDPPNLTVVKTIGAGTTWNDVGQTVATAEPGYITSGSFNSFSTFTLANLTGGGNPLPIELVDFSGKSVHDGIQLNWKTASEIRNDHFNVERSYNGKEFESFATVKGQGTTSKPTSYEILDSNPYPGLNYYRLFQTDWDGKYSYSKVISVLNDKNNFEVYPNPTSVANININKPFAEARAFDVLITNSFGQPVHSQSIIDDGPSIKLQNVRPLSSGLYIVILQTDRGTYKAKLMIVE
jgi:hypothetical protein